MDRTNFIKTMFFSPAIVSDYANGGPEAVQATGLRRLKADKWFTQWRPDIEPAYHAAIDEVVLVGMSHGMPGLVTRDGTFKSAGPESIINPQTGPIFIDGIEPGDMLAIDIMDIKTGEWGYCSGQIFELKDGYAMFSESLRIPLEPMIGCIGVAPSEGIADTRVPRETGGNLDCRDIRAGSTIVLRSRVKGALVGMGDAHALQGDGEINGQGIETDAEAIVRFRKFTGFSCDRPVIIRNESFSTLGAHKDLEEAAWQATEDMISLLRQKTGRSEKESRLLVGLTGNLKINQIVDPAKGARMEVPSWIFGI